MRPFKSSTSLTLSRYVRKTPLRGTDFAVELVDIAIFREFRMVFAVTASDSVVTRGQF